MSPSDGAPTTAAIAARSSSALSHLITVPTFGPDMMIMIGLGVGIDYALFVVTRYRQGLAERQPPRDATIVALSTAGRAVLFAGATVVIALLGLFVVGQPFMDGLAVATIVAVALVLVAALTLLPAMVAGRGHGFKMRPCPDLRQAIRNWPEGGRPGGWPVPGMPA